MIESSLTAQLVHSGMLDCNCPDSYDYFSEYFLQVSIVHPTVLITGILFGIIWFKIRSGKTVNGFFSNLVLFIGVALPIYALLYGAINLLIHGFAITAYASFCVCHRHPANIAFAIFFFVLGYVISMLVYKFLEYRKNKNLYIGL